MEKKQQQQIKKTSGGGTTEADGDDGRQEERDRSTGAGCSDGEGEAPRMFCDKGALHGNGVSNTAHLWLIPSQKFNIPEFS